MGIIKYFEDLGWLKKIMFFIFLGVFLYCLSAFFLEPTFTSQIDVDEESAASLAATPAVSEVIGSSSRDCAKLLSTIAKRQIFAPLYKPEKTVAKVNPEEVINKLKLVGIITTEPVRAIVNDLKDNKTYYLEQGGSISEYIKINQIKKDSVIIDCYGERFELYL